jgi:hypothetical protein
MEDDKSTFYLFLLQVIKKDTSGALNYFTCDLNNYFINDSTLYLKDFLMALDFFQNKNFKAAKRILTNLSYVDNPYLASWARLLEIVINYKQGNEDFAVSLLKNELKRMDLNKNRIFSMNSNLRLLKELSDKLLTKTPSIFSKLNTAKTIFTPYHQLLFVEINKQN